VRPREDGDLSAFTGWVTLTHTQRCHAYRQNAGRGHLYQGRFKSFPVEEDEHFLTLCRYVERNALRAGLVKKAEDWRWSGLWRRLHHHPNAAPRLTQWPVPWPDTWVEMVNQPLTDGELATVQKCVARGKPYGTDDWATQVSERREQPS